MSNITIKLSPVAKAVAAFVVGLINFIAGLIADDDFTASDTANLVAWIVGTIVVHQIPNKPNVEIGGA